jgi:hypothetical protein
MSFPERSDGNLGRLLHGDAVTFYFARQSKIPIAAVRLGDDMGGDGYVTVMRVDSFSEGVWDPSLRSG